MTPSHPTLAALAAAALAAALCPGAAAQQPAGDGGSAGAVSPDAYVETLEARLGGDVDALRSTLGEPDSTRVRARPNRFYAGHEDASISLHFPGVTVRLRYVARTGERTLNELVLTDPGRTAGLPVSLGDSVAAMREALGPPVEVEGPDHRYRFGMAGNLLEFRVSGGSVERVRIGYRSG